MVAILTCSCASEVAKVKAFISSSSGKADLGAVAMAADAFAPPYAGVIALGLYGLEAAAGTPTPTPTSAQVSTAIASVTGSSKSDTKVVSLANAVLQVVQNSSTPVAGLNAAAAIINPS